MIAGLVLAGGEGRRLGGNKAMTMLAGAPLASHAARALAGVGALAVAGSAEAARALGATALEDPPGLARGPLAGVLAGLEWAQECGAVWLAVLPCDVPLAPRDLVERLRAAVGEGALVCAETELGLEPLISLWRTDLSPTLRAALAGGGHPPVHALARDLGAARVRLTLEEAMNVNTPEDLARIEAALRR